MTTEDTGHRPPCVGMLDRDGRTIHRPGNRLGATACGLTPSVCTVGPMGALVDHASGWCPECYPEGLPT